MFDIACWSSFPPRFIRGVAAEFLAGPTTLEGSAGSPVGVTAKAPPRGWSMTGSVLFRRPPNQSSGGPLIYLGPRQQWMAKLNHKGSRRGSGVPRKVTGRPGPVPMGAREQPKFFPSTELGGRGVLARTWLEAGSERKLRSCW